MMKNSLKFFVLTVASTLLIGGCSSTPKGSDAYAYARVKDWRKVLNLRDLERKYDLPSGLLSAVMHQESSGKANALSRAGAEGLFQIMPITANEMNLSNAYSPQPASQAAAAYLSKLYRHYNSNLKLTLAAYNWGIGNVDRYVASGANGLSDMPRETQGYVARVIKLRKYYD